jgi:hypothetical protein
LTSILFAASSPQADPKSVPVAIHPVLAAYRRGEFRHREAEQIDPGDHGSRIASRIVFGHVVVDRPGYVPPHGQCRYVDAMVPADRNSDDELDRAESSMVTGWIRHEFVKRRSSVQSRAPAPVVSSDLGRVAPAAEPLYRSPRGVAVMPGKWKIKAVVVGALVDNGGSVLLGVLISLAAAVGLVAKGASPEQLAAAGQSFGMLAIRWVGGTGFTLLGGYVAARIAKEGEVRHALASSVPSLLLGVVLGSGSLPTWCVVVSYVVVPPAAALGGVWARARNRSKAPAAQARRVTASLS